MTWREVIKNLLTGVGYLAWGRVQTTRIELSEGITEFEGILKEYLDEMGPPPGLSHDPDDVRVRGQEKQSEHGEQ